jgi:hypothetical protein
MKSDRAEIHSFSMLLEFVPWFFSDESIHHQHDERENQRDYVHLDDPLADSLDPNDSAPPSFR